MRGESGARVIVGDADGRGLAHPLPARKMPQIWKTAALLRFSRLQTTVPSLEPSAGAVRLIQQGQTRALGIQSGVFLDKFRLRHFQIRRDTRHVTVREEHVPRPAATGRAALTLIISLHTDQRTRSITLRVKMRTTTLSHGGAGPLVEQSWPEPPLSADALLLSADARLLSADARLPSADVPPAPSFWPPQPPV
jgi:hypothetical protein